MKKYYEANKDKIYEHKKEYYEANKDKISEKNKEYREANKDKISEKKKDYYEANKNKLCEKIICACDSIHTLGHKSHHEKTKKHQQYIQQCNV